MPSKFLAPSGGWSQDKQRSNRTFFDQHKFEHFPHGRPWYASVERPADGAALPMPVGEMLPDGWNAPWLPEAKYMVASIGKIKGNDSRFTIDYPRMVSEYKFANDAYYTKAAQIAAEKSWPMPTLYGEVSFMLRAVVGSPPKSPRIPEAAIANDPWLLGFRDEPNHRLRRLLLTADDRIMVPEEFRELTTDERSHALPDGPDVSILSEAEIKAILKAAVLSKKAQISNAARRERAQMAKGAA